MTDKKIKIPNEGTIVFRKKDVEENLKLNIILFLYNATEGIVEEIEENGKRGLCCNNKVVDKIFNIIKPLCFEKMRVKKFKFDNDEWGEKF